MNVGLQQLGPPVIASVQGMATAGGCQLAASCDLIVASEAAAFCVPGTKIQAFCHTPGVALAEKVHPRKALEMLLLAEDVPAREAERIGLVNKVVPPDQLDHAVTAMANKLAGCSVFNIQEGKKYAAFADHGFLSFTLVFVLLLGALQMSNKAKQYRSF